jgi:hypothetical protein
MAVVNFMGTSVAWRVSLLPELEGVNPPQEVAAFEDWFAKWGPASRTALAIKAVRAASTFGKLKVLTKLSRPCDQESRASNDHSVVSWRNIPVTLTVVKKRNLISAVKRRRHETEF